jgi:hypothetical protein
MQALPGSILHDTCLEVASLVCEEKKPVRLQILLTIYRQGTFLFTFTLQPLVL